MKQKRKANNGRHLGACIIEGCEAPAVGRNLCNNHWLKAKAMGMLQQYPKFQRTTCDECDDRHYAKGKCQKHYRQMRAA